MAKNQIPTSGQVDFLQRLRNGPHTQVALAEAIGITQQAVSMRLATCRDHGWIDDDGRLTDEGKKWLRKVA